MEQANAVQQVSLGSGVLTQAYYKTSLQNSSISFKQSQLAYGIGCNKSMMNQTGGWNGNIELIDRQRKTDFEQLQKMKEELFEKQEKQEMKIAFLMEVVSRLKLPTSSLMDSDEKESERDNQRTNENAFPLMAERLKLEVTSVSNSPIDKSSDDIFDSYDFSLKPRNSDTNWEQDPENNI